MKRLIVLSAPSGAGKTTVARHLLAQIPNASFSVSATTRARRGGEVDGKDYFFLTREAFATAIEHDDLIEYEEIFGHYYGTLRSQVKASIDSGKILIFDVDVKGALSLRQAFPDDTLLIFIAPPSMEILEHRLRARGTEGVEQIRIRLSRAEMEMAERDRFDLVIVNDDLQRTLRDAEEAVRAAIQKP
jgi:guanylate kinase